ncbi:acyl-CoA synthetase [Thermodesulfobacteriota bacterium]
MTFDKKTESELRIFNVASAVQEAAGKWGDRVMLHHYDGNTTVTYGRVNSMSSRVGNGLKAIGTEIENRVIILMDDCPEYAYIFIGSLKIGAVPAPLNPLLSEKDYAFFLADSRAKVLFVSPVYYDKVKGIIDSLPFLRHVVLFDSKGKVESGNTLLDWETFLQGTDDDLELAPTFLHDMAYFVYTSGSTGRPRAMVHSHNNLRLGAYQPQSLRGIREGEIQYHVPKLYWNVGINGLISTCYNGSSMVLLSGQPKPLTVLEILSKYRPTLLTAPPTMLSRLIEVGKDSPHLTDLSSIRYLFCTGEALPPALFQSFREMFGVSPYNCWGAQELNASAIAWQCGEEVPLEKVGSCGRSTAPGVEVKIVDESGNDVPDGVQGELLVKTDSKLLFYWHEPEETSNKFFKGWFKPNDSFMRDEDGYYWYLGRLDDTLKIGGRQIFTAEIETTVAHHPAVLENAIIPVTNDLGLTEMKAFVVLKEGYEPTPDLASEIQDHVKEKLAPFKRPHQIEFIKDLPKTATGKIQRFRLREKA